MSVKDYEVVFGMTIDDLEEEVQRRVDAGMIPHGALGFPAVQTSQGTACVYTQLMVSEELHAKMNFGTGNTFLRDIIIEDDLDDDLPGERPLNS